MKNNLAKRPSIESATAEELADFVERHPRLFVLTGAGISTESGIPDYRDKNGDWKRKAPILHQDFLEKEATRQRYWARSLLGWRYFGKAEPGPSHRVLAGLEQAGRIAQIVTQNVDGLHQRAGSKNVIDLHGRVDRLICLECKSETRRRDYQPRLEQLNPRYAKLSAEMAPDGDADLNIDDFSDFIIPACENCMGRLMPDVVFYGGSVPKTRYQAARKSLHDSDAVLVVGSSLMVFSGYRFCREAAELDMPIAAINLGRTRADALFELKVEAPCGETLEAVLQSL